MAAHISAYLRFLTISGILNTGEHGVKQRISSFIYFCLWLDCMHNKEYPICLRPKHFIVNEGRNKICYLTTHLTHFNTVIW